MVLPFLDHIVGDDKAGDVSDDPESRPTGNSDDSGNPVGRTQATEVPTDDN